MRNRKRSLLSACVTLSAAFVLLLGTFATHLYAQVVPLSKTYNWKMVSPVPAGHHKNFVPQRFIDTIAKRTDGKVKISLYEGTLGAPTDHWDMLKGGAVQIGYLADAYNTSRMPISSLLNLPFEINSPGDVVTISEAWFKAGYLKEVTDNFKLLAGSFTPVDSMHLFMRNKKVSTMADLKGMKFRSLAALHGQTLGALGATGVSMPAGELYMALQTGVVDGAITAMPAFLDRRLQEVCKFGLRFPSPIASGAYLLAVNKETWDGLPKELQNLLDEVAREVIAADVKREIELDKTQWEAAQKAGVTTYTISVEEMAKWKKATSEVDDKYVAGLAAKGYPSKEALEMMRKAVGKK